MSKARSAPNKVGRSKFAPPPSIIRLAPAQGELPSLSAAAEMHFRAGRYGEAIVLCNKILSIRPNLAEVHNNIGAAFANLEQPDQAEQAYRRAISLKSNYITAYRNLSILLGEVGRLAESQRLADQALRLALATDAALLSMEDRIDLHFELAKIHEDSGRFGEAFAQWLAGNALKRRQVAYNEAATFDWLDRVRKVFSADLIRARSGCGDPSSVPVFILGMPRSGTTLVEQILASHPHVFGAGELPLLAQTIASAGNATPCPVGFPEMALGMTSGQFRRLGADYVRELARRAPGAARITDKMPHNFRFAGFIHLILPKATIIHTVRDPLDTCVSNFATLFAAQQDHTYDLAELGRYYRRYQELMAHWRRVLPPGQILDVRYEDIVTDLEGAARRIVAHCGLDWDARCLDFHRTERIVRTTSATQVRQPLYKNSVERWRRYERFLGPLLAELGPAASSANEDGAAPTG